ncbi:MAG: type II toxin-antitoxin system HipA family toxin [Clostridiales bacterium]|nr:type II toxin-antitoxin system HipA family toxin [Clostridiales bacterium]
MEKVKKLTVIYNGSVVGYLAEISEGRIAFQYDEQWVRNGFSVSPFSLPLTNEIYYSAKQTFGGLFGVFNDSLPDGWGELLVKRMLAKSGVNYDRLSPLTKLALINGNGLGGLSFEPTFAERDDNGAVDLDELCADVHKIFDDEAHARDLDLVYALGGSSGGARPKAHIKIDGEEWIVKFPCKTDSLSVGLLEYKANCSAKKCGITTNEFMLFPSKICEGYFGAKRFDRLGDRRVHMISFAALLETSHRIPNLDYMHLFQVAQNICSDKDELYEIYRRMCFNVFYGNRDDHGKNFSFVYDESKASYSLSPAYDLTKVTDKPEHEMTVMGKGKPVEPDLIDIANAVKLSQKKCLDIIKSVKTEIDG